MEGVIALMIPVIAVSGLFLFALSMSPVGKAVADRLRNRQQGGDQEELRDAVDQVRREVAELAERVDFTERLLAKQQGARLERPH
jgi:hypothetical protein